MNDEMGMIWKEVSVDRPGIHDIRLWYFIMEPSRCVDTQFDQLLECFATQFHANVNVIYFSRLAGKHEQ